MYADYVILAAITALAISGGVFLISQAKNYRARHHAEDRLTALLAKTPPGTKFEEIDFGPPVGKEIGARDGCK